MIQYKEKITVKFLVHESDQTYDLFAYFPLEVADNRGNRVAYSHIGQHSGCHPSYAQESRKATKEEYNHLKNELEQLGYNLNIL